MADARSKTSAENGKKGGRPISQATLRTQEAREYISKQLQDSLAPIVAMAITQAIKGETEARKWISEYSWGKPAINLGVDEDGMPLKVSFDQMFNK